MVRPVAGNASMPPCPIPYESCDSVLPATQRKPKGQKAVGLLKYARRQTA